MIIFINNDKFSTLTSEEQEFFNSSRIENSNNKALITCNFDDNLIGFLQKKYLQPNDNSIKLKVKGFYHNFLIHKIDFVLEVQEKQSISLFKIFLIETD